MGKARLILTLLFALAISSGVVAGMLVAKIPASTAGGGEQSGPRTPLGEELGLSKEQSEAMRVIWEDVRKKVDGCFLQAQELQKRSDMALFSLLTDEQKTKYAKIQKDNADALATLKGERDGMFQDAVKRTEQILSDSQKQRYHEILQNRLGPGAESAAPDWLGPQSPAATQPATNGTVR
jgi:hypothetical protein